MRTLGVFLAMTGAVVACFAAGLRFSDVINVAALLVVGLPTVGAGLIVGGPKAILAAKKYTFVDLGDNVDRGKLILTYTTMGRVAVGAGIFGMVIGLMGLFPQLGGDSAAMGRGVAASLTALAYGLLIQYFLCVPLVAAVRAEDTK